MEKVCDLIKNTKNYLLKKITTIFCEQCTRDALSNSLYILITTTTTTTATATTTILKCNSKKIEEHMDGRRWQEGKATSAGR